MVVRGPPLYYGDQTPGVKLMFLDLVTGRFCGKF